MSKETKPFTLEHQQQKENKELFKIHPVDGTPFSLVETFGDKDDETEGEYHVVLGKHRLNPEPFNNFTDAEMWAEEITWDKIMAVIYIAREELDARLQNVANDFYNHVNQ